MKASLQDRFLAAGSYIILVSTLYIILSKYRKNDYLAFHAAQTLFFWLLIIGAFLGFRYTAFYLAPRSHMALFLNLSIISSIFLWSLSVFYGITAFLGGALELPLLSRAARLLI